jgi:hypothetical protein
LNDKLTIEEHYETFKPAITKAGFEAYRVDEDPSVSIPIEQIENGIREVGLSAYERIVITAIVGNLSGVDRAAPEYIIRKEAGKNGLTDFAISLGLNKLSSKQFITHTVSAPDEQWGNPYLSYSPTELGWQWLQDNEDQFVLHRPPPPQRRQPPNPDLDAEPDDIPF